MNKGAVFLYGNEFDENTTVTGDGRLSYVENLLKPGNDPKAEFSSFTEQLFEFSSVRQIEAIAILGADFDFNFGQPAITIEIDDQGGFDEYEYDLIVADANAFQPRHLVALIRNPPRTAEAVRLTLNWGTEVVRFGGLFMGRAVQAPELADTGWSVRPEDVGDKDTSVGGQIYADSGPIARVFEVQHQTLTDRYLYGFPADQVSISFPKDFPVLGGSGTYTNGVARSVGSFVQYFVSYENVITPGNFYSIEYAAHVYAQGTAFSPGNLSLNGDTLALGRRVYEFEAAAGETDLDFVLSTSSPANSTVEFELLSVKEQSDGPSFAPLFNAPRPSLSELIARSGTSGLVGVCLRPSSPAYSTWTTFFGFVESFAPYRDRQGNLTGGGLRIRETL